MLSSIVDKRSQESNFRRVAKWIIDKLVALSFFLSSYHQELAGYALSVNLIEYLVRT